jgi:hypothetical protein
VKQSKSILKLQNKLVSVISSVGIQSLAKSMAHVPKWIGIGIFRLAGVFVN